MCQYDLSEAERQPILQAEALKEKDKTIVALKDEIAALRGESVKPEYEEPAGPSQKLRLPPRSPKKASPDGNSARLLSQGNERNGFAETGIIHMADDVSHM